MGSGKHYPPIVRFHLAYRVDAASGCWLWLKKPNKEGYGTLQVKGRGIRAHRCSYEHFFGPIPDGLLICHKCDVRLCVNPAHLFLGMHKDNTDDMIRKGRYVRSNVKLTNDQVRQIRIDATSMTQREVARRHGIDQGRVSLIVNGKLHGAEWP